MKQVISISWLLAIWTIFLDVISASSRSESKKALEIDDISKIQFGSFAEIDNAYEDHQEELADVLDEVEIVASKTMSTSTNDFHNAFVIPPRGDRFSELKAADTLHTNRFLQSNHFPARLTLRLGRDFYSGPSTDYSMEILHICVGFMELPVAQREDQEIKKIILKNIFAKESSLRGRLAETSNSLLHPICYDAMKYLGDAFEPYQINWLIENIPEALFTNVELMTSLNSYSFMDHIILENFSKYNALSAIDFLSIPNFIQTAPLSTLLVMGTSYYEQSKHYFVLFENRRDLLEELASVKDDPRNYPFLSNFNNIPNIPVDYLYNSSLITAKIRTNGLTPAVLGSLIAYLQESNDLILNNMLNIAMIWADVHKNSHFFGDAEMNCEAINKEFNERVYEPYNTLLYLREKRDDITRLLDQLETGEIPTHPTIIKSVNDKENTFLTYLKLLVEVPFHLLVRHSFNNRGSLINQTLIHPDDANNTIPLPRILLHSSDTVGFRIAADPAYYFNSLLWSSLWRNIFFSNGESWRQDPEIIKFAVPGEERKFEEIMNQQYEVLYKSSASAKTKPRELLSAWQKLSVVLPETFKSGPRFCRFIAALSIPAPPEGLVIPQNEKIERQVFAKRVALALKDIQMYDWAAMLHVKENLKDSPEIVSEIETRLARREFMKESNYVYLADFKDLEKNCADLNRKINQSTVLKLAPGLLFRALKLIDVAFASLGKTLSDEQIHKIASNSEISVYLAYHGRALTRSQIDGLLKSESGRMLLKTNIPLSRNLMDYSGFELKDFEDIGLELENIRLGTSTVSQLNKLMLLTKKGFSSVDDPIAMVQSLGLHFWSGTNVFKNLSMWELLNPLVMAIDTNFSDNCGFIHHMTGMKAKLHSKISLSLTNKFLVKWLIAQDWYAFQYHVINSKGNAKFGPRYIESLNGSYSKYIVEGETPARKDIMEFMHNLDDARCSDDSVAKGMVTVGNLASLSVFVDTVPLTAFRAAINASGSPFAKLLSALFESDNSYSGHMVQFIFGYMRENFKGDDLTIWQARLEILMNFAADETGLFRYVNESRALTRSRLRLLPKFDALIYKWALELEGVDVEEIFRDTSNVSGPLDIDRRVRIGIVPPVPSEVVRIPVVEAAVVTKRSKKDKSKKK